MLKQKEEEEGSGRDTTAPSARKKKVVAEKIDAEAAALRKKVKGEKQRLLELQRLNSSLEREVLFLLLFIFVFPTFFVVF